MVVAEKLLDAKPILFDILQMKFIAQGFLSSLNRRVQYWSHRLFESFHLTS